MTNMPQDNSGQPSLKDAVLGAIKGGQVAMRPRWHFVLRSALIVTGVLLVFLALLFVASFIVFTLRLSGAWFMPAFGYAGVRALLGSLPWILILTAVTFVLILEILVQRYAFAYRRPLFATAIVIILLAALGGFAVARTPFHGGMYVRAQEHRLPMGERLYRAYGTQQLRDVHPGEVSGTADGGFLMRDVHGAALTVRFTADTRFPYGTRLTVGDAVVVFGERRDDEIRAFGVRRVDDRDFRLGPRPWNRPMEPPHGGEHPPRFR